MIAKSARILAISVDQAIYMTTAISTPGRDRVELFDQPVERFDFTGRAPRVPQIKEAISNYLRNTWSSASFDIIGISTIGVVDHRNQRWVSVPRNDWRHDNFGDGIEFKSLFEEALIARHLKLNGHRGLFVFNDASVAAITEGTLGAAQDCGPIPDASFAQIIVGSGVNAAIVAGGRPVLGRCNPELGHVIPQLHRKDAEEFLAKGFRGTCHQHRWRDRWCLEGLISEESIGQREWLQKLAVRARSRAVDQLLAFYLSQLCAVLVLTSAPLRIVVTGERVSPPVIDTMRKTLASWIGDYPAYEEVRDPGSFITPARFPNLDQARLAGVILVAERRLRYPFEPEIALKTDHPEKVKLVGLPGNRN